MKKVLATLLCVLMLVGAVCVVPAFAETYAIDDIPTEYRLCPDKALDLEAPAVSGDPFARGWEVKYRGGDWIPYGGESFHESDNNYTEGVSVRYFAADEQGNYSYSNVCKLTIAHVPAGQYQHNDEEHWRVCDDCGGRADVGYHTSLTSDMENENCTVCGAQRAGRYSIVKKIWDWLMNIIMSLIG